jgi:von Willebrand factor type A domain
MPSSSLPRHIALAGALLSLSLLAAASCGDSQLGNTLPDNSPCADASKDVCGTPCNTDDDCASGTYCAADGKCFADCTPDGGQCGTGQTCSDQGKCRSGGEGGGITLGTGGGGGGTTQGGGNTGGSCGELELGFTPETPTVVLLIDQSGSMTADFNNQGTRWDVVYDALMDPVDGVVKSLEEYVRFGLALYTYSSGPTCPELVEFKPPMTFAHTAIDAIYSPQVPLNNTPTGDSLSAITPELAAFAEPGPKIVILATDGDPDRCEDPDAHDQVSMDEATNAAQGAFGQGIQTFIIAVGDQVSEQHQQDMANAGQGLPVPAPAANCDPMVDPATCAERYNPQSKQGLIDDLTNIILGQRTCVFALDGEVIPGKECEGQVTVNGMVIPCNDADGWQLNSPTEIEFVGAACDTILTELDVAINATFPCDSIVGPPS